MKRRPVLLYLTWLVVALLADDVTSLVQWSVAGEVRPEVAIHAEGPSRNTAIRLMDGVAAAVEVVRNGRLLRDAAATRFVERHTALDLADAVIVDNAGRVPTSLSSLVAKHTRLQV